MHLISSAYGLDLDANLPIPGLVVQPTPKQADVQIWLGAMPPWLHEHLEAEQQEWFVSPYRDEDGEAGLIVWKLAAGAYFRLRYSDGTEFIVDRSGTRVWARWPPTLTLEDTATYLLGPVLGFVLRLRGVTCLHASAVAIGDRAIALVGAAGAGKSTMAAAFAEHGYSVLSDDVTALEVHSDHFRVQPGYPHLRLWPSSVDALYGPGRVLPQLTPNWDKRCLDLTQNGYQFQQQPLPLAAAYVLGHRYSDLTAPHVDAVPVSKALMCLVANTYVSYLLDKTMRARDFDLLGRIVTNIPVRRVHCHANPACLSGLCEVILNDFRALSLPTHAARTTEQIRHV